MTINSENAGSNQQIGLPHSTASGAVRVLAGAFADGILSIWQDDISGFLVSSDVRRHVWFSWLTQQTNASDLGPHLRSKLASLKSRDLIADAFGATPVGYLRALGKIGSTALAADFYPALSRVLTAGGDAAKYIYHARSLTYDEVIGFDQVLGKASAEAVVKLVRAEGVTPLALKQLVWLIKRLDSVLDYTVAAQVLTSATPLALLQDHISNGRFPNAPFSDDKNWRAVRTPKQLREVGHRYRNCLQDADKLYTTSLNIQNGRMYLYEWVGLHGTYLLSFVRFGQFGWVMREARSTRNLAVAQEARELIMSSLSTLPEVCPLWADDRALPIFDAYVYDWMF